MRKLETLCKVAKSSKGEAVLVKATAEQGGKYTNGEQVNGVLTGAVEAVKALNAAAKKHSLVVSDSIQFTSKDYADENGKPLAEHKDNLVPVLLTREKSDLVTIMWTLPSTRSAGISYTDLE